MAGTQVSKTAEHLDDSMVGALRDSVEKLIDDVELLRSKFAATLTKLDADAGVTDTNYSALNTVAAASLLGYKVKKR